MGFPPENIKFSVACAENYVRKTGSSLPKKKDNKAIWPVPQSALLQHELALALHLSDMLGGKDEDEKAAIFCDLYRLAARYQTSRVRHIFEDYNSLLREYGAVERKRKRRRALAVKYPSREFMRLCITEAKAEFDDITKQVRENIERMSEKKERKNIASQKWGKFDELAQLDMIVKEMEERLGDVIEPIKEAKKEDREKMRLWVAMGALFIAVTVGAGMNMIPETEKAKYWALIGQEVNSGFQGIKGYVSGVLGRP